MKRRRSKKTRKRREKRKEGKKEGGDDEDGKSNGLPGHEFQEDNNELKSTSTQLNVPGIMI